MTPGTAQKGRAGEKKRVVITTFGSFGDLNPAIGLALGLKARGHDPVVATAEVYRPRAGLPQLVVPHAHDQPDNARRITRLGVAKTLHPRRYSARRAAGHLGALLGDPAYRARAARVAEEVRTEDGVGEACDALEGLLAAEEGLARGRAGRRGETGGEKRRRPR